MSRTGAAAIADSPDEIRLRVREQFMQGASQVKLVGGGGVSTPRSPLDMPTFSEAELRAAVEAAADWDTYVAVHAYAPPTVQRAVTAGVQCIEHAHLMDDTTARMMAKKGTWLSIQPFLCEEDTVRLTGPTGSRRCRFSRAPTTPISWRRSTGSKRHSARTCCSRRRSPRVRARC